MSITDTLPGASIGVSVDGQWSSSTATNGLDVMDEVRLQHRLQLLSERLHIRATLRGHDRPHRRRWLA